MQALELKSINNMLEIHRKRNDLMSNEPTGYSYTKIEKESQDLLDYIIANDATQLENILKIKIKIEHEEQSASSTLADKLENNKNGKPNFAKALKAINKS